MAVGALIGAYQEDDSGRLRALIPLAGRSLVEYQVRCAFAAGAAPIVVLVERVPQALQDVFERLRLDGISVVPAGDVHEAVSRFDAASMILLIGDGVVASAEMVTEMAEESEPAVGTVQDDEAHQAFERIDSESRWAGLAVIDSHLLGATARMLGDWDLQSTLLRRTIQEGARRIAFGKDRGETILVESVGQLGDFQRSLLKSSRSARTDWPSRYLIAPLEDLAVERLMEVQFRPQWLVWAALVLTIGSAAAFIKGWPVAATTLLLLSTPLDLLAARLASLRLRPLAARMPSRRALWPAAGVALLALGWFEWRHGSGWGAFATAVATAAFAEAARIEKAVFPAGSEIWLFSRRGAIFGAIPFALLGAWTGLLIALFLYSTISFFLVQHVRHSQE